MGKIKNWGFNINYKWVEGFFFEGLLQFIGFVFFYGLLDGQVNYNFNDLNIILKIGVFNIFNNEVF